MSFATLCYGEEGTRLDQAFDLSFDRKESPFTILLKGDSGVGKTFTVHRLAAKYNIKVHCLTLGDLAADYRGQLSKGFKRILWSASNNDLLLIEDIDLFFPQQGDVQDRSLLSLFTRWAQKNQMMMIATTRHPNHIATGIRPLFTDEIQLDIPTPEERFHMLSLCLTPSNFDVMTLARRAHAFVAADLAKWCQKARLYAHQQGRDTLDREDFEAVFNQIRISGMQYVMAERPDPVYWTDIGGLIAAKNALEESAVWVYKHANAYKRLGVRPSKGLLLFGPPGTGKTLLAKAVATESSANFLPISIPDLIKGEVGESEKAVSRIFQTAIRCSPCVIFFDELEAIFASRDTSGDIGRKLISQFLIEMDQLDKIDQSVIILGATNHPEAIDSSILRPGRFDRLVYVGPPNLDERIQILQVLKHKTKLSPDVDLELIGTHTEGYTGADLKAVIRKAALLALKNDRHIIEQQDIQGSLSYVTPSCS
ncbi:P-loop containing nucleoside triphosphate hydrolase protein [Blakeslea trispora]|nr:P-loop containing nucleoside triphosphate hydrolase protein [Blakeslea trispora]